MNLSASNYVIFIVIFCEFLRFFHSTFQCGVLFLWVFFRCLVLSYIEENALFGYTKQSWDILVTIPLYSVYLNVGSIQSSPWCLSQIKSCTLPRSPFNLQCWRAAWAEPDTKPDLGNFLSQQLNPKCLRYSKFKR